MIEGYRFVGVLNLFNLYPDFLFPIYQKGEEFFFHNGKKNRIYSFEHITESVRKKIIFLNYKDMCIINDSNNQYFFEHDTPVYAFQKNERQIFCADLGNMIKFLSSFTTEDAILKKQIEKFINENILEFYINILCTTFPQTTFFNHGSVLSIDKAEGIVCIPENLPFANNQLNYNILHNLLMFSADEVEETRNYKLIPGEKVYMKQFGVQGILWPILQNRIGGLSKYERVYEVSHEMYHMDYCICRLQNIYTTVADFARLKRDFHDVIRKISYTSPYYDVCIKCQNAVVNGDENALILLINKNRQLISLLQETEELSNYLEDYIQSHMYKFSFELS